MPRVLTRALDGLLYRSRSSQEKSSYGQFSLDKNAWGNHPGLLGVTFGLSPLVQPKKATVANEEQQASVASVTSTHVLEGEAKRGYSLFDHSCAPCQGDDARGDEGGVTA